MEQPANSPENSRPDGAEVASGAEDEALISKHKEEDRLDSRVLTVVADRDELARVKETHDHTEVVIELPKVDGPYINVQGRGGWTPLIKACINGHIEVVIELLKDYGLDINVQGRNGYTALIWACIKGHDDIALKLLRDPRIDRHVITIFKINALAWARNKGLTAVVTRCKALDRGDERMPLVKVHQRYLHGDVAAEGAQAQAPHPSGSAITKILVDKYLMHYISRFLAP